MATNKTDFLGLNDWIGTDPFKRDEFNANFRALEAKAKEHEDTIGSLSKVVNEYEWTATAGQLTYVLPENASFDVNHNWLTVSVGGFDLAKTDIQIDSSTQFTLLVDASDIPDGVVVAAKWVEPYIPATAGHHDKHEAGGSDEIDVTKLKNYQEAIASPLADNATNPKFYGVKGDWNGTTGTNDTTNLQTALNNFLVVDLKGKSYYVTSTLNVRSYQLIINGKIIAPNLSPVFYGNNVNNVTFQGIEIDGRGTSEKGIYINGGSHIVVESCNIHDLKTINDSTIGVYLQDNKFSKIHLTDFANIIGTPNAIVGDSVGSSRAVLLQRCFNTTIDQCNIFNISSTDDGDGIHIKDDSAGYSTTEIEIDAYNVISNCLIKNCTRSGIKIQQSGVFIYHNDFQTDDTVTTAMDYGVRVYGSNITISDNRFECFANQPILIGIISSLILKNVTVKNNYITYAGAQSQGGITLQDSPSIQNVLIDGNTIIPTSTNTEVGVYIRTYAKNVRIVNNQMINVVNGVFIRDITGVTPTSNSVREKLIISNNDVVCLNNLVYESSANIYDGLVVTNNLVNITAPLSYAQNSVRLSNQQLGNNPIIQSNRIKNGFPDGLPTSGATSNRPTAGTPLGFRYHDTTLNKPVFAKTTGVKEVDTLTINSGATTSGNITIALNGVNYIVAVTAGQTAGQIGDAIRAASITAWIVGGTSGSSTVTFTKTYAGTNTAPTFTDTGSTGTTGSIVVTTAGANPTWIDATGTTV